MERWVTYYDGGSRNPYTINIRGSDESSLVICFEELQDTKYSGLCEGAQLDVDSLNMTFGPKTIYQIENASDHYDSNIWSRWMDELFPVGIYKWSRFE